MAKKTYTVLNPVEFDHQRFEIGAAIDLDDKDAAPLLTVKAVELAPNQTASATVPTDEAERLAAIVAAVAQIDPANPDLWLKDGKPATEAIAAITGWPLTAAERNAAWASMQPTV
jgi:hypothetical protein